MRNVLMGRASVWSWLALGATAAGCALPAQDELGQDLPATRELKVGPRFLGADEEQPVGRMYSALLEQGIPQRVSEADLPEGATVPSVDLGDKPAPVSQPGPLQPGKLDLDLQERIAQRGSSKERVEVMVTFQQTMRTPRFPRPDEDESRDSAENSDARDRAQQLVGEIRAARQPGYEARAREFAAAFDATEKEHFWLIDAMVLELPLDAVTALSKRHDVQYVELTETSILPPTELISVGRATISSDPYFGYTGNWMGLLDTGIRHTHEVLSSPNVYSLRRDCNQANASCTGGDPTDQCTLFTHGHGTATANILVGNTNNGNGYRGVTPISLDSWKIYNASCFLDRAAAVRGFEAAVSWLDRVIVAEIQDTASETGSVATAADAAFDAGSVVVAAAGNNGSASGSIASPGSAHKALAVGAVDATSLALQSYSGRGPTGDSRTKPDILAPTNVWAASRTGDTTYGSFGGTSGATPFAAGATALARNFLRGTSSTIDPGQVYAFMIMTGEDASPDNNNGAGLVDMPLNGHMHWGSVDVTNGQTVNVPLSISPGTKIEAAVWWPESTSTHNDIDLRIVRPDGTIADSSLSVGSVFEKVRVTGNPPNGTWNLRVNGYSVTGTQKVYYALFQQ